MKNAELLEIEQAPPARLHLAFDRRVEAAMLAKKAAEGAHQRHIAHDVGHFAVNGRGLAGEIVVQRPAGGREAEHDADHEPATTSKARGHRQADGEDKRDRRDRRRARRQDVPDEHVLAGEHRVRRRGHAARQRAGQTVGEIARRMPGEMAEQIAPQIASHADKSIIRDPARHPPKQIVGGDQRAEEDETRSRGGAVPCDSMSTRNLTPYCVPTEQATAPITAARMTAWGHGRSRT